jgi:hypothetical protein
MKPLGERKKDKGKDTFDFSDWWKSYCLQQPAFSYVLRAVLSIEITQLFPACVSLACWMQLSMTIRGRLTPTTLSSGCSRSITHELIRLWIREEGVEVGEYVYGLCIIYYPGYVLYTRTETLVLVIYCMRPWSWSWLYYICTLEWHMSTKQSINLSIIDFDYCSKSTLLSL